MSLPDDPDDAPQAVPAMGAECSLGELSSAYGLTLRGDPAHTIDGVGTLARAGARQLGFLANPRYRASLAQTRAGAVVMRAEDAEGYTGNALISANPYASFARIAQRFDSQPALQPGVHPSAVVAQDAVISAEAQVDALCVIESGARIEAGVYLGPGCVIGRGAHIGRNSQLLARVTICAGVTLGERVRVHPGAVIGADGFGIAPEAGAWIKVPQLGSVRIGDDCEIGANSTIDRGALDDTVLEEDVRIDNQVQIAHNVWIGAHTALAGCSAVAGSARIGRHCLIGGGAGVLGHLELCDRVTITARTLVTHSIREPGEYSSGTPVTENRRWRRNAVRFNQLDELARRVARLEKDKS